MPNKNPTVGIYTLGCKVNQYESEAIAERFEANGFDVCSPDSFCDVYLINTCTVTGESDRKARQFIRRAIHQNPSARILVTGCFSQVAPEQIAAIEGVDYVCGNANKQAVVAVARELLTSGKKDRSPILCTDPPDANGFEPMYITKFNRTRAYLKIEDGCENRCTYCIIPNARGKVRSKDPEDVLKEVRTLTEGGCREIVLTGIETASYGKDLLGTDLADLLLRVDQIPGVGRIRLGSLDPSLFKPSFVEKIAGLRSLTPHFHLSLQSGSDSVLVRMKRKYNSQMAADSMQRLREVFPDVQFTTDVIVGFPQESEAEFEETLRFCEQAKFLMIHVFPYSRRKGTPAAVMDGQIPEAIKHERVRILSAQQATVRKAILDRMNGRKTEVLFETWKNGVANGHTPDFVEVECHSDYPLHAQTFPVLLKENDGNVCRGTILNNLD